MKIVNYKLKIAKGGFTLIEVLVAATIIVLLTSIGMVSYQAVNRQARDAKRKADLEQIRAALQIYRGDCGNYPTGVSFGDLLTGNCTGSSVTYMQQVPQDSKYGYSYKRLSSGASYVLCAHVENTDVAYAGCPDACDTNSCGGQSCNYEVCPF